MVINQKCIITITGNKEKPDCFDMELEWTPVLNVKSNSKNHPAVSDAVANILHELKKQNSSKIVIIDNGEDNE